VLPHRNHKHEPSGNIIAAEPPELSAILDELMEQFSLGFIISEWYRERKNKGKAPIVFPLLVT
jgi:hypothetical protein